MDSPIIRATWQAGILSAISNILAQGIASSQRPFSLNVTDLVNFVLYALLSTPPNFVWQAFLESKFPGYPKRSTASVEHHDGTDGAAQELWDTKQLNFRNTAIKFALDQTIGAMVNTVLFIGGLALLRGEIDTVIPDCKEQFLPLMLAGQKLWPAVSLLSFLFVPVEYRTTFGSIVGLFWGVYLSLISSSDKAS